MELCKYIQIVLLLCMHVQLNLAAQEAQDNRLFHFIFPPNNLWITNEFTALSNVPITQQQAQQEQIKKQAQHKQQAQYGQQAEQAQQQQQQQQKLVLQIQQQQQLQLLRWRAFFQVNPMKLGNAPLYIKSNPLIVKEAVESDPSSIQFVGDQLFNGKLPEVLINYAIQKMADLVKQNGMNLKRFERFFYIDEHSIFCKYQTLFENIAMMAIYQNKEAAKFLPYNFKLKLPFQMWLRLQNDGSYEEFIKQRQDLKQESDELKLRISKLALEKGYIIN